MSNPTRRSSLIWLPVVLVSLGLQGVEAAGRAVVRPSRIAFTLGWWTSSAARDSQVFLVAPDGTGLLPTGLAAYSLDLSPDSSQLVIEGTDGQLHIANADGSAPRSLGVGGHAPVWSPDGRSLAFMSHADEGVARSNSDDVLAVIGADGLGLRTLGVVANSADWSPAGDQLVFSSGAFYGMTSTTRSDAPPQLYRVRADGTGLRPLGLVGFGPRWSPDGTRIAFVGGDPYRGELVVAHLDAAGSVTRVGSIPVVPYTLAWSPDGSQLVFSTPEPDGPPTLHVVNADGTGSPRSLGVVGFAVSWRRVGPPPAADLELTKTVDKATPHVGETVTFTVRLVNRGPEPAGSVSVTDVLPAGLSLVTATASRGTTYSPTTSVWSLPSVAPDPAGITGARLDLTVRCTTPGVLTNLAEVTASDLPDPDSTPNNHVPTEDDIAATRLTVAPTADLELTKSASVTNARVGDSVTFTVTVTNNGPNDATGIQVAELPPATLAQPSATASAGTTFDARTAIWSIPTLPRNGTATLGLSGAFTATGDILNGAEITASDQFDPDSTPNNHVAAEDDIAAARVTVIGVPSFQSSVKGVDNPRPERDAVVEFRLDVVNGGSGAATQVLVVDAMPAGLEYVPGSAHLDGRPLSDAVDGDPGDFGVSNPGALTVDLATVTMNAAPRIIVFRCRVTGPLGAVIRNEAVIRSAELSPHVVSSPPLTVSDFTGPTLTGCSLWNNGATVSFSEEVVPSQAESPANWQMALFPLDGVGAPTLLPLPDGAQIVYVPGAPGRATNPPVLPEARFAGLAFPTSRRAGLHALGIEDPSGNPIDPTGAQCTGLVALAPGATLQSAMGGDQVGPAGAPLPVLVTVRVVDAQGNPVPGVSVHFSPDKGAGQALPGASGRQIPAAPPATETIVPTGLDGQAAVRWILGPRAGSQRLQVTAEGDRNNAVRNAPVVFTATATATAPATLLLTAPQTEAPLGGEILVTATVVDEHGNSLTGVTVDLTVTEGQGGLALSRESGQTDAHGQLAARLTGISLGPNTVVATVPDLPELSRATLTIAGTWQLQFDRGLQLFTIPFDLGNPNPAAVLGIPGAQLRLARFDPVVEVYETYRHNPFPFQPGRGYFGLFDTTRTVTVSAGQPGTLPAVIPFVASGWQLIGNPVPARLPWRLQDIEALGAGGAAAPLSALLRGVASLQRPVEPYLWVFNPGLPATPYQLVFDPAVLSEVPAALQSHVVPGLEPGQGAWALVNQAPSGYRFTAALGRANELAAAAESRSDSSAADCWSVELLAACGEQTDGANVLGAGDTTFQVAEPPPQTGATDAYVSFSFAAPPGRAEGSPASSLAVDVRTQGASQLTWRAVVRTNRAGETVTLSWPDLSRLPNRLQLFLVDELTGRRQNLRTTTSYRFRADAAGTTERWFVVESKPSTQVALRVLSVVARQAAGRAAGAAFSYALTGEAEVQVNIKSPAGRTVAALGPTSAKAGLNSLSWSGRSAAGHPLPAGLYLVEVVAQSADGARARGLAALTLR